MPTRDTSPLSYEEAADQSRRRFDRASRRTADPGQADRRERRQGRETCAHVPPPGSGAGHRQLPRNPECHEVGT